MIEIKRLEKYDAKIAEKIRELLIQLSRSGKDKGEIPEQWFNEVINSPWHDLLLAIEDGEVIGIATMSVTMGAGINKNAFLEDFVVDEKARGKGVGNLLWEEMLKWSKEKGCKELEFTSGRGREAAQEFYKKHGAEIYETNFFRKGLNGQ